MNVLRQVGQVRVVLLSLTLAFGIVAVPFLLGRADSWDMVGHLSHAQMQRQMLPQMVFWNPHFYSGYEQYTAYPPLLSLLVALLSFPLGLVGAFKAVTVLSWVALPPCLYYLYRGILPSRLALVGSIVAALVLVLVPQQIGGTFFSTLVVGNVANSLGLVFFALCLGFVLRGDSRGAIPLLALLAITHMIAAVVLSLFIGTKLLCDRRGWSLLLGYGLAALWLVPALLDTYRDVSTHDDYPLTLLEYALYVVLFASYVWVRRQSPDRRIDFLVLGLGVLFFLVGILRYLSPDLWASVPMHFHRVKIYSLVVAVLVLLWVIAGEGRVRPGISRSSLVLTIFGGLATAVIIAGAFTRPYVFRSPWVAPRLAIEGARVMTVEGLPEIPYWHNFRHFLADRGHLVSKGLFIEASPDAPFLLSLEQILDRDHAVPLRWGIDWDSRVMQDPDVVDRIPFLLDLFGIQAVATNRQLASDSIGISGSSDGIYRVLERPKQPLIDVPPYPIKFSGGHSSQRHWQSLTRQWFVAGDALLVVDSQPQPLASAGTARLVGHAEHYNEMVIEVEAQEPVPVLIRMGYSDKWRAYAGSRELPVYRVTPNQMLVPADEDFELRYEPLNRYNYLGLMISAISLLGWYRLPARGGVHRDPLA